MDALKTDGRWLVEATSGRRRVLRGVNLSGLEYARRPGFDEEDVRRSCGDWGATIIRLPLNQAWALGDESYLETIDRVVASINGHEAYALLDLQWLDAERERGSGNRVPPLPEPESLAFWRKIGRRYRAWPGVLFDVFNEPHDPLPDDEHRAFTLDGRAVRRVTWAEWRPWAEALIDALREEHREAVAFVSGIEWGYDLRGAAVGRENVVYSTHVYRARGEAWAECFGELAKAAPVFAGEWGGSAADLGWGTRLAEYFDELEIGWTAWSWRDRPVLQRAGMPTGFGQIVRDRLLG